MSALFWEPGEVRECCKFSDNGKTKPYLPSSRFHRGLDTSFGLALLSKISRVSATFVTWLVFLGGDDDKVYVIFVWDLATCIKWAGRWLHGPFDFCFCGLRSGVSRFGDFYVGGDDLVLSGKAWLWWSPNGKWTATVWGAYVCHSHYLCDFFFFLFFFRFSFVD